MNPKTDLTLMRYCGHFLIKAEDGAKNYKRDHRLPLAWRSLLSLSCSVMYGGRYVKQNSSARHVYVMWAELGHSHFL